MNQALLEALWDVKAQSVSTGQLSDVVLAAAQAHADWQAKTGRMGHQGFAERSAELRKQLPDDCGNIREVAAVSGGDEAEAAKSVAQMWRKSGGHWRIINSSCKLWGYAMAQSESGSWYAAGLVAG